MEIHFEEKHKKKPCKYCGKEFDFASLMAHDENLCKMKPKRCNFCDVLYKYILIFRFKFKYKTIKNIYINADLGLKIASYVKKIF